MLKIKWLSICDKDVINMAEDATEFARVDAEIKEQAECILSQLGLPMSSAINLFLKRRGQIAVKSRRCKEPTNIAFLRSAISQINRSTQA